ncbi:unnamed protein product [Alopecurus aequalis]
MLLQRLLAVSGRLRRSFSTFTPASRPPWIMVDKLSVPHESVPRAQVRVVEPPRVSDLCLPANLVATSVAPNPQSYVERLHVGQVCSVSSDGLLFVQASVHDHDARARQDRSCTLDTERFVCNALTGQLSRIPDLDIGGPTPIRACLADRGHGPPNRFAVADLKGDMMCRFLSETGEWEYAETAPYRLPLARPFCPPRGMSDQEAFPFGGRLWWVEHRLVLSQLWADGGHGHPWLPLPEKTTPQIGALDPLNALLTHSTPMSSI